MKTRGVALLLGLCLLVAACGSDGGSAFTSGLVQVPDVVGQSVEYARGRLESAGLVVDVVDTSSVGELGRVAEQVPAAGTEVAPGSSVVVKVPANTTTTVPAATTVPVAATSTTSDYEAAVIGLMRQPVDYFPGWSDAEFLDQVHQLCELLELSFGLGSGVGDFANNLVANTHGTPNDMEAAGTLMMAMAYLCDPSLGAAIRAWLDSGG